MKPDDVNPHNFKQKNILYSKNGFSIAFGEWVESGVDVLAMRWDGDSDNSAGYPKTFGHPVWFIVPEELTFSFANAILELKEVDNLLKGMSETKKGEIL